MYKVVTHTITEEHYDHPSTASVGLIKHRNDPSLSCGNTMPGTSSLYSAMMLIPSLPDEVCFEIYWPPGKTDGNANIKVKLPVEWESYDAIGDLNLYGDLKVNGDLTVTGTINSEQSSSMKIGTLEADLKSNDMPGTVGDMAVSSSFAYLCVDKDTWVRWPIQTKW